MPDNRVTETRPLHRLRASMAREGLAVARERGHDMSRVKWRFEIRSAVGGVAAWRAIGVAVCRECGEELYLKTHPAPNEIDISGGVCGGNCRGRRS